MTQMLETVIRLRVLLQLSINSLAQLSLGLSGPQQDSLSLLHSHTFTALPPTPPCILSEPLASLMGKEGTRWTGREETVGM